MTVAMNRLSQELSYACSELALRMSLDFELTLDSGIKLAAVALIPSLGSSKGMLIFSTYDSVRPHVHEIAQLGYGFSVLDELPADENFDLESIKRMFAEWGWNGVEGEKPPWIA